ALPKDIATFEFHLWRWLAALKAGQVSKVLAGLVRKPHCRRRNSKRRMGWVRPESPTPAISTAPKAQAAGRFHRWRPDIFSPPIRRSPRRPYMFLLWRAATRGHNGR